MAVFTQWGVHVRFSFVLSVVTLTAKSSWVTTFIDRLINYMREVYLLRESRDRRSHLPTTCSTRRTLRGERLLLLSLSSI